MHFEIIGAIKDIETIAVGSGIRVLPLLRKRFGSGRWRKLKGFATVRLNDLTLRQAEIHWFEAHGNWFEAHGIGKKKIRIKRFLD